MLDNLNDVVIPRGHHVYGPRLQSAAVVKAMVAARLYMSGQAKTLKEAATTTGATVSYVRDAVTVLKANDPNLEKMVHRGMASLPTMAAWVRPVVRMVEAFTKGCESAQMAFVEAVGTDELSDLIAVVNEDREYHEDERAA